MECEGLAEGGGHDAVAFSLSYSAKQMTRHSCWITPQNDVESGPLVVVDVPRTRFLRYGCIVKTLERGNVGPLRA